MSWDFYTVTHPIARKDYPCDAMEYISYAAEEGIYFTQEENEIILDAKSDGSKILKGTRYIKVTGKWDGEMCTFRARPEIHDICKKYELYPDD